MLSRLIAPIFVLFVLIVVTLAYRTGVFMVQLRDSAPVNRPLPPSVVDTISFGTSRGGVIAANPSTSQIFVAQEDVPALAEIDATTNRITAVPGLGGYHTGIAVNEAQNEIYVSQEFSKTIRVINGTTGKFERELPVDGGSPIGGLAFDPNDNHLYVIQNDIKAVAILDYRHGAPVGTIPINAHYGDLALNPQTQRLYIASPLDNQITIVDTSNDSILKTIPTGKNPKALAVNSATNRIYVAVADDNVIGVIDGLSNALIANIPVAASPIGVAVNPLTNRIYTSNLVSKDMTIIDGNTNTVVATVQLPEQPGPLAMLAELDRVYVSSDEGHGVFVIQDSASTSSGSLSFVSDETVRQMQLKDGAPPADWTQPTFDDQSWNAAVRENCSGRDPMPAFAQAEWIWDTGCVQAKHTLLLRKTFDLPKADSKGVLRLRVDEAAQVYVNGQRLGDARSWTTEFWYDLTPYLRQGRNVLALQAENNLGYGEIVFRGDFR